MLSDHPATPERIRHVDQYIAEHHLGGTGGTSGTEIAAVKTRLQAIPPRNLQARQGGQAPQGTGEGGGATK